MFFAMPKGVYISWLENRIRDVLHTLLCIQFNEGIDINFLYYKKKHFTVNAYRQHRVLPCDTQRIKKTSVCSLNKPKNNLFKLIKDLIHYSRKFLVIRSK